MRVVVRDRAEWLEDEKMLPAPPECDDIPAPPAPLLIQDFDCAVSELIVSGFVASVGAADLLLSSRCCCPSSLTGKDMKLPVARWSSEVPITGCRSMPLLGIRCIAEVSSCPAPLTIGTFSDAAGDAFLGFLLRLLPELLFRLVIFLIHDEKTFFFEDLSVFRPLVQSFLEPARIALPCERAVSTVAMMIYASYLTSVAPSNFRREV